MKPRPLNANRRRFVEEYLIDLNATQAYRRAYPDCKSFVSAATNAGKLLRNPQIRAEIRSEQRAAWRRLRITADRVLREIAAIAFADIAEIEGRELREIPITTRKAVQGIKHKELRNGTVLKEYVLCDKMKALELLFKRLGLAEEIGPLDAFLAFMPPAVREAIIKSISPGTTAG